MIKPLVTQAVRHNDRSHKAPLCAFRSSVMWWESRSSRGRAREPHVPCSCTMTLLFSSCLERGGRSNEIAKQDWKQRPECCYFWCWSRSGGKERRALHAAHDICCLLNTCPFAPEEVLLVMYEIHHRWSEVGDRPKTLWAQLIQSGERLLLMWTFWTEQVRMRTDTLDQILFYLVPVV